MKRFPGVGFVVVAFQLLSSQIALACPVCFAATNDENANAFAAMTGFMTILPLTLIGSAVWWYVRRIREFDKRDTRQKRGSERHALRRRPNPMRGGELLTAPEGYFERGYAGTAKGR